jgi:hypothetical protein
MKEKKKQKQPTDAEIAMKKEIGGPKGPEPTVSC